MEAYLDNAATTRCYEEVADIVRKTMLEDYGNPSAMHTKGVEAERYVKQSAETIARILKVKEKEIFFTSGGTESNNWAIFGTAMANRRRGKKIITSRVEHAAVSRPLSVLEELGWEVIRLGTTKEGVIDTEELKEALSEDTVLVSVMMVNNEIGSIEPVSEIGEYIRNMYPGTVFHVDAIQGFGKLRIYPKRMKIDLLSASGHKIHGPKGSGFLFADERIKLAPIIYGGGQQGGMRSGTDNVPGVAGLGVAAARMCSSMEKNAEHMYRLKERLAEGLMKLEDVTIHGPEDLRAGAPHVLNASVIGIRSEVLLHTLEDRKIYVSSGSACSSHHRNGSATMLAIGATLPERESSVRFSFSEQTSEEEIDYALEVLEEVVPKLRKYTRH